MSAWRLTCIIISQAATRPYLDFTWWSPIIVTIACLEVSLAIICASMPIAWPIIEKSFASIFVKFEVEMVEERVSEDYGFAYELEHRKQSVGSTKSSGTSTRELTDEGIEEGDLRREYTLGVDPLNEAAKAQGLTTEIQSQPKAKWEL